MRQEELKEKMEPPKFGEAMTSLIKEQKAYNEVQAWLKNLYARQRAKPKPQDYDYIKKRLDKLEKRDRILQQIIQYLWEANSQSNTIIAEQRKICPNKDKVDQILGRRESCSDLICELETALQRLEEE